MVFFDGPIHSIVTPRGDIVQWQDEPTEADYDRLMGPAEPGKLRSMEYIRRAVITKEAIGVFGTIGTVEP